MVGSVHQLSPGLRLRIARPDLPPGYVHLSRVDAALDECRPGQVTVVAAGPGYGKTLAVVAWSERSRTDQPVAWLIADATDTAGSFWGGVLTSLAAAGAVAGDSELGEIVPGGGFGRPELDRIIDGLADLSPPATLVVDEVHRLEDAATIDSLNRLLENRPSGLRLILIGRSMARLKLERLRLADQLVEITADMLAVNRDEAAELCARTGTDLGDGELDRLLERTQGWPAGIRLALLGSRGAGAGMDSSHLDGRADLVAAYLLEEVLENIAPSDRRFLLSTSVVPVMTPDLARALTGRSDSRAVLDALVAANMLTVRLSDRPDWYAYHPMLLELLYDRLTAENPDAPAGLHRRAAQWFVSQGDSVSAIRQLTRARDWPQVADLLSTTALPLVLSTQASSFASALGPAEEEAAVHPTADTLLAASIAAFRRGDHDAMVRAADDAAAAYASLPGDTPPGIRIVLALVRMVDARVNHLDDVVDRCGEILALAESVQREQIPAAPAYSLIARNNRAIGLFHRGADIVFAADELAIAKMSAEKLGMDLMSMAADCYLALADLVDGTLPAVAERTAAIRALAERRGWMREPQLMALHAATAWMHLECGGNDQAEASITTARSMAAGLVDGGAAVIVDIAAVRLAITRGDAYATRIECGRLAATAERAGPLPSLLATWTRVITARARILFGENDAAVADLRDLMSQTGDAASSYQAALIRVAMASAHLARNQPGDALEALGPAHRYAPHRLQAAEAAILSAVASSRLRRDSAAQEYLAEAVRLAAPVGLIRPFVMAESEVGPLLARHQHLANGDAAFVGGLIADGDRSEATPVDVHAVSIDPLTDRELVVLGYLPTMYKAAEIAADLFVSVNTVKTHQQAIYRKLGVSTRRAAVDRARACNLL